MAVKKKDPVEEKRQAVKAKVSFSLFIALLLVLGNALVTRQEPTEVPPIDEKAQKSLDVLVQNSVDDEKELIGKVQSYVAETKEQVEDQTGEVLSASKKRVSNTVSDLIYSTTIEPLINKIQALPDDQQIYVKEAICREIEDNESEAESGP